VLKPIDPIVVEGKNCWRVSHADAASVIIDAADYYHHVQQAMEAAQQQILIIGWDFDTRINLEPGSGKAEETLGEFFLRLAKANPERSIKILKWAFGARKQFFRLSTAWMLLRWQQTRAIEFKFDSAHPVGCSHHQKIVVIDDALAVCGGIDMSKARWDTSEHNDDDPRRALPNGKLYPPWHDVTMMMSGTAAQSLRQLGEDRWKAATKLALPPITASQTELWPAELAVDFRDVRIAIARTRAAFESVKEIREIEALNLDMIAAAKQFIYIENQYLTSAKIAAAIAKRMGEPSPPDIVVVMPRQADGWLEQKAMDAARVRLARAIGKVDTANRFRVYVPVTKARNDIYVHAKVAIVDDRFLRVGSSNMNNRSLGLDSECDVIIDTALPGNAHAGQQIAALRNRLIAEHLGVESSVFAQAFEKTGSLVDAIDMLRGDGKSLDLLDLIKPGPLEAFIADNELLDPAHPGDFLEPISQRSIWKNWRKGMRWRRSKTS
jgi:phosphatidylserine/phosphatidylglycerophosphate/cardiolipin synthase-like enzyme